jgi:hypothetical protein
MSASSLRVGMAAAEPRHPRTAYRLMACWLLPPSGYRVSAKSEMTPKGGCRCTSVEAFFS